MKLFRNDILENLWLALATLRDNKLRSFLTVIGVIIGVVTVMLIASIISGIDTAFTKEVEAYGTRSMYISKYNPGIHVGRMSREERMRKPLTYDDAVALSKLPAVEVAVPFLEITNNFFGQKILVSGGGKTSASVALQGTLPDFEKAGTQNVTEGRFFSQFENAVVLIGPVDPLLQDLAATPFDAVPVPKVGIHGNLLKTIVSGIYLRELPWWAGRSVSTQRRLVLHEWLNQGSPFCLRSASLVLH